jgi:MFS transporter, SP family, sugar:H+ symporter
MAPDQEQKVTMREHWKSLSIVTLVSLSSFQYGLDFGIIGGLQAMIGFLEASAPCVAAV